MTTVRVLTEPLGGAPVVGAALMGATPPGWYPTAPLGTNQWRERADAVRKEPESARWLTLLEPAFAARGVALERLQRSANGAGIVITTGQQPGLFGGPMYGLSKALSALAFADELQWMTGIPVAPVFWAATDDADIAEASSTIVSMTGGAKALALRSSAPAGTPVATAPLGDVSDALSVLAQAAGSGSHSRYLDAVRRTYVPSATFGDAYVSLMRDILEELGIAVLDASHPAVRDAGDLVSRHALRSGASVDAALRVRNSAIESAGWSPQVALVKGLSLVFATEKGVKRRLPLAEAERAAADAPRGSLSPNVLLRPILERAILPTVAYIAGPGELAYFAQLSAVAGALGAAPPLALPRWSGTVLEPHVERLLDRYALSIDDLRDPHAAETRFARAAMPASVAKGLQTLRKDIAAQMKALGTEGNSEAALLPAAVTEGAERNIAHRLDRLERRFVAAQKRLSAGALTDIATARGSLFPDGKRQERALNPIPLLTRHGPALLSAMLDAAAVHASQVLGGIAVKPEITSEASGRPASR